MEERSDKTALGLTPRLIAAGWFAVAALVGLAAVILVLSPSALVGERPMQAGETASSVVAFLLFPAWVASFFGFAFGARILDLQKPRSAPRSMLIGMVVAILSYLTMPLANLLAIIIFGSRNAMLASPTKALYWILLVWGVGAVLVGWLLVIIGGVAGFLLFKFSLANIVQQQLSQARRLSKQQALICIGSYAFVGIGVMILLVSRSIWRG
jgi:hypothetical protein